MDIAAAIIAARTLSSVGGPLCAGWPNPVRATVAGAIESISAFFCASAGFVICADICRALMYAARSATAPSYISRDNDEICAITDAGVFTRGSRATLIG